MSFTVSAARTRVDRVGVIVSVSCALHCLAIPIAFATIPSLTLALYAWGHPAHRFATALLFAMRYEWLLALAASSVALLSTALGWGRHRRTLPAACAVAGSALLLCAALSPLQSDVLWHTLLATVGGGSLAAAHLFNLRAARGQRSPS